MNDRALKVLEQYDLEVISTRRGRGSYILETPQGLRILSDYSGSENKALFQNRVMERIREGGYERVDLLLPNKEGGLISRDWEENGYVVKEWYTGRECDTASESEILIAVANLAQLHLVMQLPEEDGFRRSFTAPLPWQEADAQNAELKKIRSFLRKKNTKGDFERLFLDCFSRYFEQAQTAQEKLAQLQEKLERERMRTPGAVCHGDYDHHHVLMMGYETATTDFDHCRFDFQVNDLYRFMRKILEKHSWNPKLGMRMLEHYGSVRPLSAAERRLLYAKMLYPEKFRKLANYYYGSRKAWISRRFQDKLERLNSQEEQRGQFIKMLE